MSEYEQNTQQSPGFGLSTALQTGHSWKYRQRSVGMGTTDGCRQSGHVMVALIASLPRSVFPAILIAVHLTSRNSFEREHRMECIDHGRIELNACKALNL